MARPRLNLIWVIVCLAGVVTPATATTFVSMDDRALAKRASAVVVGRVTAATPAVDVNTGGVKTLVSLAPEGIVAGTLPAGPLVLTEMGGRLADRAEHILGAAEYSVGEHVLAYLTRARDGTLRTTSLALGKYAIEASSDGTWTATRQLGAGVALFHPRTHRLDTAPAPEVRRLDDLIADVHSEFAARGEPVQTVDLPAPDPNALSDYQAPFTLLSAARWFEPDTNQPVLFSVDATGEISLGATGSQAAVDAALAAWTDVASAQLVLADAGTIAPQAFDGCSGPNRVVFNDPFNEVDDPSGCGGILAIGGYCTSNQTTVFNNTVFERITVGKVMFNNGWAACGLWSECELAEVATHEIGHTIGLGHSNSSGATMAPSAHFDGRCAGLAADDVAGVSFIYGTPITDSIVDRRPGQKMTIAAGKTSAARVLTIIARNGDFAGSRTVQLVASSADCPAGTIGTPDFDSDVAGSQDSSEIAAGRTKKAKLTVSFDRSQVDTPNAKSAQRCTVDLQLGNLGTDSHPTNNVLQVPIDVIDRDDDDGNPSRQVRDSIIEPIAPLKVSLARNGGAKSKSVSFKVRNADLGSFPDHSVHVTASAGDCPAAMLGAIDLLPDPGNQDTANLAPGGKRTGKLTLSIDPAAFTSGAAKSPARCTATVSIDPLPGETNLANNSVPLVIDVSDRNDF